MKNLALAVIVSLSFITAAARAEDAVTDPVTVAESYLAAYSTFDVTEMEPFLADDIVFSDPTSTNQDASGGSFSYYGKAAMMEGLGDYAAQYKDFTVAYDVKRRYDSNGVVVFIGDLTYTLVTKEDKTFTGTAPVVTAITVKDGKVVKHLDLYDYQGNAISFNG